jgi:glycosyltransferase involved in cell wall biosynthesis
MKILFIIDHLRPDGTQKVLTQLVEGLEPKGFDLSILCLKDSWDAEILKKLESSGAQVRILDTVELVTAIGLLRILRWMRVEKFDVVVTMLFYSDVIGRLLARMVGNARIISSIRARNIHYTSWQRWCSDTTLRRVDVVVVNSRQVHDFLITESGIPPDKIHVIHNGVNPTDKDHQSNRERILFELGLSPGIKLIGSVGRLTAQKGFDLLVDSLGFINRSDTHLLIVGEGPQRAKLQAQAEMLGLERNVHLLGFRKEISEIMSWFDLYVQPSRFEGMPNALLEAMAASRPIVATAVDGICELIIDGVHGWLVPPEDSVSLANAISVALSDPQEASKRAKSAQNRVIEEFSLDKMLNSWEKMLN